MEDCGYSRGEGTVVLVRLVTTTEYPVEGETKSDLTARKISIGKYVRSTTTTRNKIRPKIPFVVLPSSLFPTSFQELDIPSAASS